MGNTQSYKKRIAVTGGAGFIGSNMLLFMVPRYADYLFINIDCLTYAGNLSNLKTIKDSPNYRFEKINICDYEKLEKCFSKYDIDSIIHFAAESHVDQSIIDPTNFINTNILGTFNLLELARKYFKKTGDFRFHHISTDEVFGSLGDKGYFTEKSPYKPNSPYSASKASGDMLSKAYYKTYGLDVLITNCSNNYGPYQFPEKLIPLMINNTRQGISLPVYGDGKNIRDWLYVEDHCRALELVFNKGESGDVYNIGGHNEIENIDLVRNICKIMDRSLGGGPREKLIEFVNDRPGHDRRYAIDASFIEEKLGWKPSVTFEEGLKKTVHWYLENDEWLKNCLNGSYQKYYENNY